MVEPIPKQAGQAPNGLLKENIRGSIFGKEIWQSGHAKCWLYICSGPSTSWITTMPSAHFDAVSIESAKRDSIPSLTTRRSTTISMECFLFFSNIISSSNVRTTPSTRARTKPSFRSCSKTDLCSPFFP